MSNLLLALLAASALALSGCATSPSSGGKQQTEMIKLPDAISAFENARREEISYAERVRIDLINIFQSNKGSAEALVEPLQLTQTMVTDKSSGKSQSVTTFDSLVIIMPLALRGTPTADKVNAQIKYIANKIADDRGSSQIRFSLLSADAKTNGIKLETATVESPNGNPVQVSRVADKNIAKGMQRVLIKANSIPNGDTLLINAVNTTGKGCKLESLLGRWDGSFDQDARTGNFYVILDALRNGVIVGHSEENDIRIFRTGNVRAEWTGSVIDGVLTLIKRYPVQGAASIEYRGECTNDNSQISGNWVINAWTTGKFSMSKRELQ